MKNNKLHEASSPSETTPRTVCMSIQLKKPFKNTRNY